MLADHRYDALDNSVKRFMNAVYYELSNNPADIHYNGLVGELSGYLSKEGVVILDVSKTKITFQIGPYKFFMVSELRLSNEKQPAVINTYEDIQQISRRLPTGEPKIELIKDLTMICDDSNNWTMKGKERNTRIMFTYCRALIKYIEEVENGKPYGIAYT